MPCESAAAGLVAVGAVARRLAVPGASDIENCARLMRERFERGEHVKYRYRTPQSKMYRGTFAITDWGTNGMVIFQRLEDKSLHQVSTPVHNLSLWHEMGTPITQVGNVGGGLRHLAIYSRIAGPDCEVIREQLGQTESCVCLGAHVQGAAATQDMFAETRLCVDSEQATIADLTSIASWNEARVSRMVVVNSRTGECDRELVSPRLLVVHGERALQRLVDNDRFSGADVVCVFDSMMERDRMEELNQWLDTRRQWFSAKSRDGIGECVGPVPVGMAVQWLVERS
jgi:hypothetical protein